MQAMLYRTTVWCTNPQRTTERDHVGFFHPRTEREVVEKAFADLWAEENDQKQNRKLLQYLVKEPTLRDAQVAATIIQWLGSEVGSHFLSTVIEKCSELRKRLRSALGLSEEN